MLTNRRNESGTVKTNPSCFHFYAWTIFNVPNPKGKQKTIRYIYITEEDVILAIDEMKSNSAFDPDGFQIILL